MQAQKFREALEKAMLGYTNKQITTAEMIAKLLELAKWVPEAKQHGQDLGLSIEEIALYDALAENESAVQAMGNDELKVIAAEFVSSVRQSTVIDWTVRESARAKRRGMVTHILKNMATPLTCKPKRRSSSWNKPKPCAATGRRDDVNDIS